MDAVDDMQVIDDEIEDVPKIDENEVIKKMDEEIHRIHTRIALEIFLSTIITVGICSLCFFGYLPWKVLGQDRKKHVVLQDRFIFTLKLTFIDILPLLIFIFVVFHRRKKFFIGDQIGLDSQELINRFNGIIENTFEQFIIKLVLSFLLCLILRSHELLILPVFTLLFIIGRVTFAAGYPVHGAFGMTMNLISILLVTLLISYRLFIKGMFLQYIYWK